MAGRWSAPAMTKLRAEVRRKSCGVSPSRTFGLRSYFPRPNFSQVAFKGFRQMRMLNSRSLLLFRIRFSHLAQDFDDGSWKMRATPQHRVSPPVQEKLLRNNNKDREF